MFSALSDVYYLPRAYKLMFLSYCVTLSNQTDEADRPPPAVCRLPRVTRGHKGLTPPPPYDSPPPYHVAIVMCSGDSDITIPAEVHISDPVYI